jgi:hypothetical protein
VPTSGTHWRQRSINPNGTISKPKESTKQKLSYDEEEGEPAKPRMKRSNQGGSGKYGRAPMKYHVRLTVAGHPTASKATLYSKA